MLLLIVGLIIWILIGCAVAWVIGSASDLGRLTESRADYSWSQRPSFWGDE